MLWKRLILAAAVLVVGLAYNQSGTLLRDDTLDAGWSAPGWFSEDSRALTDIPITWVGDGVGKTRLLYRHYEEVHGVPYPTRQQGSAPSCVGHAAAGACDILAAVQIAENQRERAPPGNASAATIYGWSRINIGGINPNKFGGGSHCRWAAAAIQRYGVVPMVKFPQFGIDLSVSSPRQDIEYGYHGVPTELEAVGQRHLVIEYIKVTTFEEVRDAIENGCPIIIGSNVGFGRKGTAVRDSSGFLNRPRNIFGRPTSRWNHAMVLIGMSDEGRKGALILNSWGDNWVVGPTRFGDEPEGSFWADARDINEIVRQGDSFAIRMFTGYPSYDLWR